MNSNDVANMFFSDLKTYNNTNFKTLANADITADNATVHKAFSSVITRYFIFKEHHPELSEIDMRILYFKLKLDLIARYFTEYPDAEPDSLKAFQREIQNYLNAKGGEQ